ncbi:MAG TPA: glycosyltransferase [Actinocatenispora sp.]
MPRMLRRIRRRTEIVRDYQWHAFWRSRPVRSDTVLYESFSGNGMLCNPEAVFRGLLDAPDLAHLRHVWVLSDFRRYRRTIREFRGHRNVSFVRHDSPAYWRALATSGYLVNNSTFPWQFAKRPGQVYLNTWHGTPLKKMGYHVPGGGPDTRNILRNFLHADYLLSGSEFMTREMYESAYKLRGVFRGAIVQEGLPRTDRQVQGPVQRAGTLLRLAERGVALDVGEKIALYAPTWKGASFYAPDTDVDELRQVVTQLNRGVRRAGWRVLLKVHQVVAAPAAADPALREMLVPNDIPTNEVLGAVDALVTDYSSIAYDFLATGRPVLHHVPDLAGYAEDRGLYVPPADWPGPVTDSVATLAEHLRNLGTGGAADPMVTHGPRYAKTAAEYCPRDDGDVTRRVVDVVFRGRRDGYDVRTDFTDGREKILVYLGGLRPNGITTSALNLLNAIDHTRFDVSALYSYHGRSAQRRAGEAAINPRVRLFPRIGGVNGSKRYTLAKRRLLSRGLGDRFVDADAMRSMFADEWGRCFGPTEFDHIVDFSGYSPMWAFLLLQGKAKSHTVWLHNDLAADRLKEVAGRQPLRRGLGALFTMYRGFDRLVSVSPALADVNRAGLAAYAEPDRFVSAVNTLDHHRILTMAGEAYVRRAIADEQRVDEEAHADEPVPSGTWVEPAEQPARPSVRLADLVAEAPGVTTFVTVGRLSPEKNHARLVDAFALVHKENPATRLIVIGDGVLRDELAARVTRLGLADAVTLAGHQDNPYAVLARSDCFVLSSDYEGQPMVILEARTLGLPVVSTAFASVRGSLPDGTGLVVPPTVTDLADGLRAYLGGAVPNPPFDPVAYNAVAIAEFYRAIGADPGQAGIGSKSASTSGPGCTMP